MFFFFVGGLQQEVRQVLKSGVSKCTYCGNSVDLVNSDKVLNLSSSFPCGGGRPRILSSIAHIVRTSLPTITLCRPPPNRRQRWPKPCAAASATARWRRTSDSAPSADPICERKIWRGFGKN
ncbi:hypothetical protein PHAVU_L001669 [Phaseolus vulgaris]|uniref:Uncharacterized protein n=1 Tax=Phaseolus vulgaris TaxID=3885 RepID=A0ACC3P0B0_PHAVU